MTSSWKHPWITRFALLSSFLLSIASSPADAAAPRKTKTAKADLIVAALGLNPSTTTDTGTTVAMVTVKNSGSTSAASSTVRFWITQRPSVAPTSKTSGAVALNSTSFGTLAAGAQVDAAVSLSIPSSVKPGSYYIQAMADSGNVVSETNESNNFAAKPLSVTTAQGSINVWVVDSLTRVQPATPSGSATTATLQAARNEDEGVQVVISSPASAALTGVTATVSDLTGPGTIAKSNVTLYREAFIYVSTPSYGSPYSPGWWPDPLIPLLNPDTGANLGQPFDVEPGKNVPLYVEVHVPAGSQPGEYKGTLSITSGSASASVPINLTVWSFTLPARPALRSNFNNFYSNALIRSMGVTQWSAAHYALMDKFDRELLRHRLSPSIPAAMEFPYDKNTGAVDPSGLQSAMAKYVSLGLTSFDLPLTSEWPWADPFGADHAKAQRYLSGILDWLQANGWLWMVYHDGVDEPRGVDGYQAVRNEAADWRGLDPRVKMLITEQTKPRDPSWGDLYGSVDFWTPEYHMFDVTTWVQRGALGEQSWMYGGWGAHGDPGDLLDRPIYEIRVPTWIAFQQGITGWLKWSTVYWDAVADPWTNPATFTMDGYTFNGDGVLFYPGTKVGYDGPIASLRLKAFRDAVDDYDYLTLLAASDPPGATTVSQWVGTNFQSWTKNPADIAEARAELARRLGGQ